MATAAALTFSEPQIGTDTLPMSDQEVDTVLSSVPAPAGSPEAPKGYTRDGKPRQRAPRKPRATTGASGAPAAPQRRSTPNGKAKPAQVDYRAAAGKLVGLTGMALFAVATTTRDDAYALDAVAVGANADGLCDGIAELAAQSEYVRKGLEWLEKASPYAALTTALVSLGAQVAVNHGKMAAGSLDQFGVTTVDLRAQAAAVGQAWAEHEREAAEQTAAEHVQP